MPTPWWSNKKKAVKAYIWNDVKLFKHRHEKNGTVFLAFKDVIAEQPEFEAEGRELVELYETLGCFPDPIFTQVWTDPYCHYWVRIAYELLDLIRNNRSSLLTTDYLADIEPGVTPTEALKMHLLDFRRIVLGGCILADSPIVFTPPYQVTLPFAIPGTDQFIAAAGLDRIEILEYDGEKLIFNTPLAKLQQCPKVHTQGCNIRLQYSLFNLPAIKYGKALLAPGNQFQHQNQDKLEQAIDLLEKYQPDVFNQFCQFLRVIAVKPFEDDSDFYNVSHSDLPGAFIVTLSEARFELVENLIHEFHHNRLFFLEEYGAFLEDSEDEASFYSPWRQDPRPLYGILHAAYVYTPVCEYWLSVYADTELRGGIMELMAKDRVVRSWCQLKMGLFQLKKFAEFTDAGKVVFKNLKKRCKKLTARIEELELTSDVMAISFEVDGSIDADKYLGHNESYVSVKQALQHHLDQSSVKSQVADIIKAKLI